LTPVATGEPPRFPVSRPEYVKWRWPAIEPIVGPAAKADLLKIREHDRRLARRLAKDVAGLIRPGLSRIAVKIKDPAGVGPRYYAELRDGYVAVYWVLEAPGSGAAVWVERIVSLRMLEEAFTSMVPADE
jgi:hypothetical protein